MPLAAIGLSSPFLSWWAIGKTGTSDSDYYLYGPYHLDVGLEYTVGGVAILTGALGLAALIRATVQRRFDLAGWLVAALIALAGAVGAAMWRTETAPDGGGNIGGGFTPYIAPIPVAAFLLAAIAAVSARRPMQTWERAVLNAAVILAAVTTVGVQAAVGWR